MSCQVSNIYYKKFVFVSGVPRDRLAIMRVSLYASKYFVYVCKLAPARENRRKQPAFYKNETYEMFSRNIRMLYTNCMPLVFTFVQSVHVFMIFPVCI